MIWNDVLSARLRQVFVILTAVIFSTIAGCGGLESSVSGVVTLDGKPLELGEGTGTVSFHPQGGGPVAQARIGPGGHFELKTGNTKGLPAGEYIVTVVATGPSPKTPPGGVPMPGPLLTPTRYGTKNISDLRFTIKAGKNEVNIPLTSK
ncbi:MAG: hypothetical protein JXM70_11495 [Pirellulales bacterium]|nr:hypothetical protein [Pirellulales bacterium]